VCPGASYGAVACAGGETYEFVRDPIHVRAAADVVAATEAEFEVTQVRPALFIWGEYPEHIVWQEKSEIYLERGARGQERFFWQIAHEAFHYVCTPANNCFHWAHEMLAILWAQEHLSVTGQGLLADLCLQHELNEMGHCPTDMLLAFKGIPYPRGLYGRAAAVGIRLRDILGWERLKALAHSFDDEGKPDVAGWQKSLPNALAAEVDAVLAG
jgi:hypothetical protein